jgi:hypothetical protein
MFLCAVFLGFSNELFVSRHSEWKDSNVKREVQQKIRDMDLKNFYLHPVTVHFLLLIVALLGEVIDVTKCRMLTTALEAT